MLAVWMIFDSNSTDHSTPGVGKNAKNTLNARTMRQVISMPRDVCVDRYLLRNCHIAGIASATQIPAVNSVSSMTHGVDTEGLVLLKPS